MTYVIYLIPIFADHSLVSAIGYCKDVWVQMSSGHIDVLHGDLVNACIWIHVTSDNGYYLLRVELRHLVKRVNGHQNVTNVGVDDAFQVLLLQLCRNDILKTCICIHLMEGYFVFSNISLYANSTATSSIYSRVVKSLTTALWCSCLPRLVV